MFFFIILIITTINLYAWKTKERKTSKFVDAGGYKLEWVDREGWRRKIKLKL